MAACCSSCARNPSRKISCCAGLSLLPGTDCRLAVWLSCHQRGQLHAGLAVARAPAVLPLQIPVPLLNSVPHKMQPATIWLALLALAQNFGSVMLSARLLYTATWLDMHGTLEIKVLLARACLCGLCIQQRCQVSRCKTNHTWACCAHAGAQHAVSMPCPPACAIDKLSACAQAW